MTIQPRQVLLRSAVLAALTALFFSCSREPASRPDASVVVAVVNGSSITLSDLKSEIMSLRGLSPSVELRNATRDEVSEAVRRLIQKAIVLREGERLGVTVTDSELEEEVRRLRSDFPPGGLEKVLSQEGIDMESWNSALRRTLLYRKAAAAIAASRATVSEEEVERAFRKSRDSMARPERIRVRQLLFDDEEKARKAREKMSADGDPEDVIRRLSSGEAPPVVADLGTLGRGDLPEELSTELFGLGVGAVSRVAKQGEGFSLFLVVGKEPARTLTLDAAAPEIREELLGRRREEAFREWIVAEEAKAAVRVQQALLDEFVEGKRK